jgi:hypothetical protein
MIFLMRMKLNDWKLTTFLLVIVTLTAASFGNPGASNRASSVPGKDTEIDRLVWLDNYQEALKQSRVSGKPIFLEFRCAP